MLLRLLRLIALSELQGMLFSWTACVLVPVVVLVSQRTFCNADVCSAHPSAALKMGTYAVGPMRSHNTSSNAAVI